MRGPAVLLATLALAAPAVAAEGPPLRVRASISPETTLFGAPVLAEVEVVADPRAVDPATIRIAADVAPFRRLDRPVVERVDADGAAVVRQRVRIACAAEACLPSEALRAVPLPRVRVTARARDGRTLSAGSDWPPLHVARRVPAGAVGAVPAWRFDETPAAASYRVSPSMLVPVLWVLAAALALAALALVAVEAARWLRTRAPARLSPLEAAIAAARAAVRGDEAARRRAAGGLARVLAERDGRLLGEAAELAWSEAEPEPARLTMLADEVERTVRP